MRIHSSQVCPAKWVFWNKTITPNIKITWEIAQALEI
jgi:hypothetical protein